MRYWYARLLVEIGRFFIESGIDLAGHGKLEIEFHVGDGPGFRFACNMLALIIALPTLWALAVIVGVM